MTPANVWALREDPYANADNCVLDESDIETVVAELDLSTAAGGRTIIDRTTGVGRRPAALVDVGPRPGLQTCQAGGRRRSHGHVDPFRAHDVGTE